MNAQLKKPPIGVIDSPNLTDFVLTKPQQKLLEKFCALERCLALANKKPVNLRLSRHDYIDLDASIRKQSDGGRNLTSVNYKGYAILSAAE
jgi:hypothetical protein